MQQSKRRIINTRAGELGHLDCHYMGKDQVVGSKRRRYLVCVVDACTRLAWAEVVDDLKALSVMFAALKRLNMLAAENGKVERFWRTLNEDLLGVTTFETVEELKEELALYILYSDTERPHQGLDGKTPSKPPPGCRWG